MPCHIAVPARHQHQAGPEQNTGVHDADHTRDVKHGHHAQGHVFRCAIAPQGTGHGVVHDGAMRVHAALGQAGGATGVGQDGQVIRLGLRRRQVHRRGCHQVRPRMHLTIRQFGQSPYRQQPRPPGLRHVFGADGIGSKHIGELRHHQMLQTLIGRQSRTGLGQIRGQVGRGHGHFRVGVGDVVLELFGPIHRVHRHHHRVDAQNGKVRDHKLGAVLHVQHHTVTCLNTQGLELPRQLLGAGHQLSVGPDPAHEDQCGFLRVSQGTDGQVHPQGCGGRGDLGGQACRPDSSVCGHLRVSCSSSSC